MQVVAQHSTSLRFSEERQLRDRGTNRRLRNAQTDLRRSHKFTTQELTIADARPPRELLPLAVFPDVHRKRFHSLTKRQILTHANDIERSLPTKIDSQLRRGYLIIVGPICVTTAIDHISW